jgi:hypothetical protein
MFNSPFFTIGSIAAEIPVVRTIFYNTSYNYTPTDGTLFSTNYYFITNIT